MTPEFVVDIGRRAVETVLTLTAPLLIVALVTGLTISIFQAATQINEQTMTFIPKIVAVLVTLLIFAPWMIKVMISFTQSIYDTIPTLGG
ncbi:flagellar biosynthesis protein FliQ [Geoalkalibacter subterraneus]|jgi:flagellar biosynthetic protein FliQ|uniref:Flagellar biosynthetic protein FliQ n=1 Tax=Geoalkalibacter subterraneus TaxID=483547 RepID=A0A0B5FTS5_9BACT|nr:flagellar biosynthesis protein FliQ [Geoalkalibacter subterraneus]AJF07585.1 flagellar biosynthesis protein FliQ [Geoalkalibacter subterraneus]